MIIATFSMKKHRVACLLVMVLLCIVTAGCMIQKESAPQPPCTGQEPVIGAWIYDPAGRGDAVLLYIFKEFGRYDAVALPRDIRSPLSFELWATGSWTISEEYTYNLTGQVLRRDFTNDDLLAGDNNETLTYDPARDILFNKNHPRGQFTRISCIPEIPEDVNSSIPFD
jgi:hypothetical protein